MQAAEAAVSMNKKFWTSQALFKALDAATVTFNKTVCHTPAPAIPDVETAKRPCQEAGMHLCTDDGKELVKLQIQIDKHFAKEDRTFHFHPLLVRYNWG